MAPARIARCSPAVMAADNSLFQNFIESIITAKLCIVKHERRNVEGETYCDRQPEKKSCMVLEKKAV